MTDALHFPLMFSRDGLDPIAELGERRATEPVSKLELPFGITAWLVTGYDAAKEVLGDATSFSNAFGNLTTGRHRRRAGPGRAGNDGPALPHPAAQDADPGIHHAPAAAAAAADRRDRRRQLDAIEQAGQPADLVETFAMPIPSLVICELLGVPYADREGFQALSTARFDLGDDSPLDVIGTSLDYLQGLVVEGAGEPRRRAAGHADPGARRRDQRPGTGRSGRRTADRRPRDNRELAVARRAGPDAEPGILRRGWAPRTTRRCICAVEELLRYLTVVQVAFPRFSRTEVVIGGQQIPAGALVLVSLSAADRDAVLAGSAIAAGAWSAVLDRPGRQRRTSLSATASTAASAPSWPGSSCGSRSRRWPAGSDHAARRCRWTS